jgi:hypothetical protein
MWGVRERRRFEKTEDEEAGCGGGFVFTEHVNHDLHNFSISTTPAVSHNTQVWCYDAEHCSGIHPFILPFKLFSLSLTLSV